MTLHGLFTCAPRGGRRGTSPDRAGMERLCLGDGLPRTLLPSPAAVRLARDILGAPESCALVHRGPSELPGSERSPTRAWDRATRFRTL
eukprot:352825-Chlamydomonas_euryale.AAC.14